MSPIIEAKSRGESDSPGSTSVRPLHQLATRMRGALRPPEGAPPQVQPRLVLARGDSFQSPGLKPTFAALAAATPAAAAAAAATCAGPGGTAAGAASAAACGAGSAT